MASKQILIIGPTWVGDSVIAQSLYKRIKQLDAAVAIDVLAPAYLHCLLRRMAEIRYTIDMPLAHKQLGLKKRWLIGNRLKNRYDQAIILTRSLKSALIPWFARIAVRTGFRGEMRYGLINDMRKLDSYAMPRLVDRLVHLGQPKQMPLAKDIPIPCLHTKPQNTQIRMKELGLNDKSPILVLAPGAAGGLSKQWPTHYFSKLAEHYGSRGYQIWILGSKSDQAVCEQIVDKANIPISNLCGKTTLEDAIDLLAQANIVVSNDSGLMHIAAAVGVSVVAIYGSTTPEYTLPLSNRVSYQYVNLSCSPCWKKTCRYGHYRCLTQITPTDTISAVDRAIS